MCRQTDMQSVFLLKLKALGTLDRRAHHLSYQVGPKSPPHIFFVLTNLDCFDLGTSLKKLFFSQGSDVAYIGHYTYLIDNKTDPQTDIQTGRQKYILIRARAHRPHIIVFRWTVSKLSVNCIFQVSYFP